LYVFPAVVDEHGSPFMIEGTDLVVRMPLPPSSPRAGDMPSVFVGQKDVDGFGAVDLVFIHIELPEDRIPRDR
jgi:hypothetical protein